MGTDVVRLSVGEGCFRRWFPMHYTIKGPMEHVQCLKGCRISLKTATIPAMWAWWLPWAVGVG